MKAKCPKSGEFMYFVEKNLPFGASISCARFQLFSDSLRHITEFVLNKKFSVTNYLDDYFFVHTDEMVCNQMVRTFLRICEFIGCPVSLEKTEWVAEKMVFLGILLDGKNHRLCLPEDKKQKAVQLLNWEISKKKVTIKFIQRLTGVLNFLSKAIVPGRTFIRGMYSKIHTTNGQGEELKQYHHISLDREFINDCLIWKKFLENEEKLNTVLCRPFVDVKQTTDARVLNFYTDSSLLGTGAVFGHKWMGVAWDPEFIANERPEIAFLELYALVAAILRWGHQVEFCNTKIIIFCDNKTTRSNVNNLTVGSRQRLKLIRILALDNLKYNRRINVVYLKSKLNTLADVISRLDFKTFWDKAPGNMNKIAYQIPDEIWLVSKIWNDN